MSGRYTTHTVITATCMGFCDGVKRALNIFLQARHTYVGSPIYILHELVHNKMVSDEMRNQNVRIVNSPEEIPFGSIVMIGAHGVTLEIENKLKSLTRECIDATCPMVKALQTQASLLTSRDDMIIYGDMSHPETAGVISRSHAGTITPVTSPKDVLALPDLHQPVLFCQTTLSCRAADAIHAALQKRFTNCRRASHCCTASRDRQAAIEALLPQIDALVIVGSANSSNANRLKEIGEQHGKPSWLVDSPKELPEELCDYKIIGIGAGASTPQQQIDEIISALSPSKS